MEAAKIKIPSGKLPSDTLCHLDDDDLAIKIRNLMQQKEELQNKIDQKALSADAWLQVLNSSSTTEIEELAVSLPSITAMMTRQQEVLKNYLKVSTELQAYTFLESTAAYITEGGDILLKFLRPSRQEQFSTLLISLNTSNEATYSVRYHNMPEIVPVAKYEEQYLKNVRVEADKNERLKKFITAITQYTRALYTRQEQIVSVEKSEILENTHVHHSSGCTFLTFLVEVKEHIDKGSSTFEFSLDYYPLDILPYNVKASHLAGEAPSSGLMEIMQDMALDMKSDPLPQVLYAVLGGQAQEQSSEQESGESGSSVETVIFGFNH
ncbi:uncharacterized protein [Procambarus clarkii]|uniref:uncharacterized protein isoform X1 n=1 Tax=Procambarus clarkii TaxID=6728 RepID=UPI0037431055